LYIFNFAFTAIDSKKVCILVTLDLKKAFNSVSRKILLDKLVKAGIDPNWFAEYLSERTQCVKDPFDHFSQLCPDLWGIPQGGVLSAILFSIFINEVPSLSLWCLAILFADDLSLLISCYPNEILQTIKKLESDILIIMGWLETNMLELNADKSECLLIGSPYNVKEIGKISINVNNCIIESKESVKILGFHIDNTLSCNVHIKQMTRTLYAKMAPLYTLRPVLSDANLITLIRSMVFPHMHYLANVWGCANASCLKTVEKFLKHAAKLVLKKKKYDSVSEQVTNTLKWLGPKQMHVKSIMCTMFKVMNDDNSPVLFKELFIQNSYIHLHNTRQAQQLHLTRNSKSIAVCGAEIWNQIDFDKECSMNCFKKRANIFVLENCNRV
jgi:hypothetical protein